MGHMTQMQRNDDPQGYVPLSPAQAEHACQADIPNMPLDWCLTRMMDCRNPSAAWRSSVKPELMVPGRKLVQTCTADGYTRYDNQCGCSSGSRLCGQASAPSDATSALCIQRVFLTSC